MIFITKKSKIMFQILQCDPDIGLVIVEDELFDLRFEFLEPELASAKIVDDYDLHLTLRDGKKKILPILKR